MKMGLEVSFGSMIQEVKRHSKSFSFPDSRVQEGNEDIASEASNNLKLDMEEVKENQIQQEQKQSPDTNLPSSLKKEIQQLEKQLQDQFRFRNKLEQALGYNPSSSAACDINLTSKLANELIKEIAVLELEVVHLERYLLSLYRSVFDQKVPSVSPSSMDERLNLTPITKKETIYEDNGLHIITKRERSVSFSDQLVPQDSIVTPRKELNSATDKLIDSGIYRCHSSLSQRSTFSNRIPMESVAKALWSCHSRPLSFMEQSDTANMISLAEHLGTEVADHVPDTPNKISEDMIKCMSAIYCKLSNPPLINHGFSSSPTSFTSSVGEFSPQDQYDIWSPQFMKDSSFDAQLNNPFHMEGLKEINGTYNTMVEVPSICRDSQALCSIDNMLQNFRSLVCKLEGVDVRKLKHDEKLAFWINIHNSLVMHAFLAYGIPQNSIKRTLLFLKAAYNVGGHTISVDRIQSSILGCRMPRPGQWLRMFLSPRTKFKSSDERQAYAVEHLEPLLHFALCTGSYSDPVVRMYTPKRVMQELDTAKEEYIRATYALDAHKEHKTRLPKIIESFAKDLCLSSTSVMEMIRQFIPDSFLETTEGRSGKKLSKSIEWVPHNFSFRYLISKELVK